jgi:Icc-related predicted phosphoesterase
MIRVAAVGDVHYDRFSRARMRPQLEALEGRADLLMIAGDLTQKGSLDEAQALIEDLSVVRVPIVAVLGNHDYHSNEQEGIARLLAGAGITLLEGTSARFEIQGRTVGVAGIKGFGGGFFGACVTEFGEPEMKAFAHHAKTQAERLRRALGELDTEFRFVLTHFSPIDATLLGEKREIYAFLGSYLLAEAIDAHGADAVFHGHAHYGTERGSTTGGVPVRNVAQPVIRHAYKIYTFEQARERALPPAVHGGRAASAQTAV